MSKNGKFLVVFGIIAFIGLLGVGALVIEIYKSGFWEGPDVKFGDQHLKTSVALIELHKTRFGRYPNTLRDLKYLGDWDPIHIQAVKYRTNDDGTKYCVIVVQGWIGKPDLKTSEEFWQGTGFDPSLCEASP